jgi:hypothetical protein
MVSPAEDARPTVLYLHGGAFDVRNVVGSMQHLHVVSA